MRRAAEILRESASPEPEAIAHHFTQAGLDDLAIEWWGKAGDQALRRSAFQEAIAHLGKAIAMADKGGEVGSASQRLKLQTSYGLALNWSRGYISEETQAAFARAQELAAGSDNLGERFATYYGKFAPSFIRGDIASAREIAETFLREASSQGEAPDLVGACRMVGLARLFQGDFAGAGKPLEEVLRNYNPEWDSETKERHGLDSGIAATAYLAHVHWHFGEVEQAKELIEQAMRRALASNHVPTLATTYIFAILLEVFRGNAEGALRVAETLVETAGRNELAWYLAVATLYQSWARARLDGRQADPAELGQALTRYAEQGNRSGTPLIQGLLAELEAEGQDASGALARIGEALGFARHTGERWTDALLHRIRGDILLKADPENPARAADAYLTAIAVAREQGARSFGLRAGLALAKLYQSTGRPVEAYDILAPALEGFSPTPEMPEIAEAQALLTALAATDEVKVEAAHRQRLTQLHVSYGNALIAARGYGAPETTEAFAKARESASGDRNAPGRLAADYGLWVGSYTRGDLPSMRAHAMTFLNDLEATPNSPEASVAHRAAGITCWFAGEYREARDHLERALALFRPGRDDDLAFHFGQDPGVVAMTILALASWPLGEVDRAISLIDRMQTRMADLTHVGTLGLGRMQAAIFELMRGDHARGAPNAVELVRLAGEQELPMVRAFGVFLEGWASTANDTPGGGLENMRRGVEQLRAQNILTFDGLLKIALAEAEAAAGDRNRAMAILDEALATADRLGYRAFEAELHRARGEMLLMRDSAATTTAEEALLTAIAVAKQQGTRSFELRAALALAKLYQSTGRPAEAHAVLAPALEGFAPTHEMPEIAEAQALLAALAGTEEVKGAATRRQRLTQLHVTYGNALIATRGYGAPETREAFAKARESASGDKDAPGRLAADYGLWAGSYMRGELPEMRTHAMAFLNDLEATPDSPAASVARRIAGVTCWCAGEYREARDYFEKALALFQPGRDDDMAFRFGQDPGIAAMANLAIASWPLGEVDRAMSLIDAMETRMSGVPHIATLSFGRMHAALFELMRGDHARGAPHAIELARLARQHELPMWGAFGVFLQGWATSASGAIGAGLDDMRQAVDSLRAQNVVLFDGFLKIALAEAEASAGDLDRALAILDEGLATADRMGHRAFESELHRARGDILLKQKPANSAPVEEALLTAIAVAKQQGTRSFELRAALALAKLYQSTGRPADAHAVLAPALEGFAPTKAMPEIAEAHALQVAIEAGTHVRHE